MPTAICNKCNLLVHFQGLIHKQRCSCGSNDLTAVKGELNDTNEWVYKDRGGIERFRVPITSFEEKT